MSASFLQSRVVHERNGRGADSANRQVFTRCTAACPHARHFRTRPDGETPVVEVGNFSCGEPPVCTPIALARRIHFSHRHRRRGGRRVSLLAASRAGCGTDGRIRPWQARSGSRRTDCYLLRDGRHGAEKPTKALLALTTAVATNTSTHQHINTSTHQHTNT